MCPLVVLVNILHNDVNVSQDLRVVDVLQHFIDVFLVIHFREISFQTLEIPAWRW